MTQKVTEYIVTTADNGYTKRTMLREIESIRFGYGNPDWGAPKDKEVFIIKLKPQENERH